MDHDQCVVRKEFCPHFVLPEKPGVGSTVLVRGQILSPAHENIRFAINLVKGDFLNIPVHIVFQIRVDNDSGVWWCSSRVEGSWSAMKGLREPFPLQRQVPFEVRVLLSRDYFTVELDGERCFDMIPLDPYNIDDINGIILAGQWGSVLITEVSYWCNPIQDMMGSAHFVIGNAGVRPVEKTLPQHFHGGHYGFYDHDDVQVGPGPVHPHPHHPRLPPQIPDDFFHHDESHTDFGFVPPQSHGRNYHYRVDEEEGGNFVNHTNNDTQYISPQKLNTQPHNAHRNV